MRRWFYAGMSGPSLVHDLDFDARELDHVAALADGLSRLLRVARQIAHVGRQVDMTGLDRAIGLLCAKSLDLQPEFGRLMQPRMLALLSDIDAMVAVLERCREQH